MINNKIQHKGFLPDDIKPEDYIFGGYTKISAMPLVDHGQWDFFLPEAENQKKNGLETMNCTVYNTLQCLEILFNRKFGIKKDYSERFGGITAETTLNGNQPHKVIEAVRKVGLLEDSILPFSDDIDTWDKYYSPKPMTNDLLEKAGEILKKYEIGHEWVLTGSPITYKQEVLKEALRFSPIGVSVVAWKERNGLYFKEKGEPDNHWTVLYGFEDGKKWLIFDSYDGHKKELEWNYDFTFAKRYSIEEKAVNLNWFQKFIRLFQLK